MTPNSAEIFSNLSSALRESEYYGMRAQRQMVGNFGPLPKQRVGKYFPDVSAHLIILNKYPDRTAS